MNADPDRPALARAAQGTGEKCRPLGHEPYRFRACRPLEKESRLLRLCVSTETGSEIASRVQSLLREDLDWGFIVEGASRHEIAPLVSHFLANVDHEGRVPRKARTVLTIIEEHTRRATGDLLEVLAEALAILHDAGIETLVLKGAALVRTVYRDPGLRLMGDADILIPRPQLAPARAVLRERMKPECNALLDTQWHLSDLNSVWTHIPIEQIWATSVPTDILGRPTRVMSPEVQLLHLCVHGDYFARFRWLCDVSEMLRARGGCLDWPAFVDLAIGGKVRELAYFKLLSARTLLAAGVPEPALRRLAPGPLKAWCVGQLINEFSFTISSDAGLALNRTPRAHLLSLVTVARRPQWKNTLRVLLSPTSSWMRVHHRGRDTPGSPRMTPARHIIILVKALLISLFRSPPPCQP
jgi:hypothetical protein